MYLSRNFFTKKLSQSSTATIAIKAKNVKRFKVFTVTASLALLVLTLVVFDMAQRSKVQDEEQVKLVAKVNALNKQLGQETMALDSVSTQQQTADQKAMSYIGSIEVKLTKINDYLSKRGLHGFSFKKVKPSSKGNDKASSEAIYSNYDNYLSQLVNNVAFMPMGYPRISSFTSFFGYRSNPFDFSGNEFHPGIDFSGKVGDPVKCTANGTVEFTGSAGGYGNCIRIKHINNIETVYGHLSRINVRQGQKVSVGDVIGKVGSTGRSTGPHLHYEVRRNGKPVNPKEYLSLN
jgi:murein DD-endopeptidase MepM/ murein hydrolase activator NlpD